MKRINILAKSTAYSLRLIYRSSKLMILFYLALDVICATLPLFNAFVLKYILDILTWESATISTVMTCIGMYIVAIILLQVLNSTKSIIHDSIFKKAEHLYDCELAEKLTKLPMSFIDTSEGKDIVNNVRYTKSTAIYLSYSIVRIITLLYTFCIAFGTLFTYNMWFSLLFLILTIPGTILDFVFTEKAEKLRRKTAPDVRKFCYYRWMLTDAWPAKDVRMYDLTEPIKMRYDTEKDEYRNANKKLDQKKVGATLLAELIMRSGEIAFTIYVALCAFAGEVTIGNMALYISFALSASSSFQTMTSIFIVGYTWTIKNMGELFEFFSIKSIDDSIGIRRLDYFESLVFENVFFKYPLTEKYILSGVSFTLNRGDKLSIVGVNGSGKSTIIKLMLGLYQIQSGQILINGYPISDYDMHDVRKMFSVLFQNFVQYPMTLRDNIALSDYDMLYNDLKITKALKQSGVYEELISKLGYDLDSYMTRNFDDKGVELSKGQWQKIALARTYFKNAPILIFDEPSATLDAKAEDIIYRNIEVISHNKTSIMISHRISTARMCNKIIVIDDGIISEQGTHNELMDLGGLYAKLYNLQKEKYTIKDAMGHE